MYMDRPLYTVPGIIINHGTEPTIIQDPGHGDLILAIHHISDGVSVGDIVQAGLASVLVLVTGMATDMDMADTDMVDADGGARPSITLPAGEDGMEVRDLMDFMVIIFMSTTTYMLTTPTMFTETEAVYPARLTIAQVVSRPERRIIIARL